MWLDALAEAVEADVPLAAGDRHVHLGREPGGRDVIVAREGLFQPGRPGVLEPARDVPPGLVVPDALAHVLGPVGRAVEHHRELGPTSSLITRQAATSSIGLGRQARIFIPW